MNQYIIFITKHWVLALLLVLIIIAIIIHELLTQKLGIKRVNAQEVIDLVNHKEGTIIDIRNKNLFKQGHIINSLNIIPDNLEQELKKFTTKQNKPIM